MKLVLGGVFWVASAYLLLLLACRPLRQKARVGRGSYRRPMTAVDAGFRGTFSGALGYGLLAQAMGWPHPEWGVYVCLGSLGLLLLVGIPALLLEQLRGK